MIVGDCAKGYIYGLTGITVEQINNTTGTILYLHHDQQGSTRLLTGSTGTVTGKCSYSPYGTPTCEGSATTPLGYDGQYTNSDTGLIYVRAREYDSATAQFMTRDPWVALTGEPYSYVGDNPSPSPTPPAAAAPGASSASLPEASPSQPASARSPSAQAQQQEPC